jgi:Cytochrome c3
MRRTTPPGTPSRASRYLIPADSGRLVRRSIAAAGGVLIVSVGLFIAGMHRLASPGTLAAAHGSIDVQCTQCHQPAKQVADLRCERCHDPIDTRRFGGAAHAVRIGALAAHTGHEPEPTCATCHADHGGRRRDLAQVDDVRCASCHTFASMTKHPEFALIRAGKDAGAGIDFSHEVHLREVAKTGGDRCLSCHTPTQDQRAFEPIAFDTHCAKCHVLNGALTLNGTDLLKSGWTPTAALPPAGGAAPTRGAPDERGRVTLERFSHRDAWTIAAAERLTRTIAGDAVASSANRHADATARLTAVTRAVPLAALEDGDLTAWVPLLDREIAALERAVAGGSAAALDPVAGLEPLAAIDPSLAPLLTQIRGMRAPATDARGTTPIDQRTLDDRRRELTSLLAAIAARADAAGVARAGELQKRLAAVQPGSAAGSPSDVAAMRDGLDQIDEAVKTIEPAAMVTAAQQVRGMTDRARQQLSGGADRADAAAARARILDLLSVLDSRANLPMRARISDLRDTVSTMTAGGDLAQLRDRKTRLRNRILLEQTLRAEHGRATVDAAINRERTAAAREMQSRRGRDTAPSAPGASVDLEPNRARTALKGLLGACLACHRLDQEEAAMRPVPPTRSILTGAFFSHRPHTNRESCDTCHPVAKSREGVDVNLPPVQSCRTCHDGSRARADCVSCHTYHPPSAAEMMRAAR